MKRKSSWIIRITVLAIMLMPMGVRADDGSVAINEKNFPDAVFRAWIAETYDEDGDGILDLYEKPSGAVELDLNGISSLKGLNLLLERGGAVELKGMEMGTLDLSNVTCLTTLRAKDCTLGSVRFNGCNALKNISLEESSIENIEFGTLSTLNTLCLKKINLKKLDLSGLRALNYLNVENNRLTSLDLSPVCRTLTRLDVTGNQLKALDISKCTGLTELNASGNKLTAVSLVKCVGLKSLEVGENPLVSLDVHGLKKLYRLHAGNCPKLKEINAAGCFSATTEECTLYVSNCPELKSLIVTGCAGLYSLDAKNCSLTGLDVRGCKALVYLYVENNRLTSLQVKGLSKLSTLDCSKNALKKLDLSGCKGMKYIQVQENELKDLDVSAAASINKIMKIWAPRYNKHPERDDAIRYLIETDGYGTPSGLICDPAVTVIYKGGKLKGAGAEKVKNIITAKDITLDFSLKKQTVKIGAKSKGGAKLTYVSANKEHISVNKTTGLVTVNKAYVGKATITITSAETEEYKKTTKKVTVRVNPAAPETFALKNSKKGKLILTWKKSASTKSTGYEIEYSTEKNFLPEYTKSVMVKGVKKVTKTLTNLEKGKKYYVRIRTYLKRGAEVYRSPWIGRSLKIRK